MVLEHLKIFIVVGFEETREDLKAKKKEGVLARLPWSLKAGSLVALG
jgi:hypothetical protein